MPLLDHFHPPLSERRHWEALHSYWASAIADGLNAQSLPEYLIAEPTVTVGGQLQIDDATFDESLPPSSNGTKAVATLAKIDAPAPTFVMPALYPDSFEVRVINTEGGPKLVAAIELVSPSNKDRPQTRRAFAIKCANYLYQGISCIIMDVVTSRRANLHNEMMDLMGHTNIDLSAEISLYATAYRPIRRAARAEIDVWTAAFGVGERLPSLPLFVAADLSMPVDFEATYQETCRRLRVPTNS